MLVQGHEALARNSGGTYIVHMFITWQKSAYKLSYISQYSWCTTVPNIFQSIGLN